MTLRCFHSLLVVVLLNLLNQCKILFKLESRVNGASSVRFIKFKTLYLPNINQCFNRLSNSFENIWNQNRFLILEIGYEWLLICLNTKAIKKLSNFNFHDLTSKIKHSDTNRYCVQNVLLRSADYCALAFELCFCCAFTHLQYIAQHRCN